MAALYKVFGAHGHIVAQVVETKFIVRTKGDVCLVGAATALRVGLMLVDAVNRQTMEHVERAHPF